MAHRRDAFPRLPAHNQYNHAVRACHDAIVAVCQRLAHLLDAPTCAYEAPWPLWKRGSRGCPRWTSGLSISPMSLKIRGMRSYFRVPKSGCGTVYNVLNKRR